MAAAQGEGRADQVYTKATTPDWDGFYIRDDARLRARRLARQDPGQRRAPASAGSGAGSTRPRPSCRC